jgi:soluble lytic murein transglycosylase-like protein
MRRSRHASLEGRTPDVRSGGAVERPSRLRACVLATALIGLSAGAASAQVFQVDGESFHRVGAAQPPAAAPTSASRPPAALAAAAAAAAQRYGLAPELVDVVARQESGYRADAVSRAGAVGVMQLMPATARALGVDPRDPVASLNAGAAYLRAQLDRFDGRIDLALAAYNAGPGAVERYAGVPPYHETQAYIAASLSRLADHSLADPSPLSSASSSVSPILTPEP